MSSIVVNSDADNATPGDGLVTLREAITAANSDTATDTGQTGSGSDTITFALGPGAHTINLTGALPELSTDMQIQGPGADLLTVRRDTGGDYRIFTVPAGSVVGLSGMSIANGLAPGGFFSSVGGGIYNAGTLTVNNCTISGNSAGVGGGISNSLIFFQPESLGILSVNNCIFSGNSASDRGGGSTG